MARPKPTQEDLDKRSKRKNEWKQFRKDNVFTQRKLADVLGISRRTVQNIEAGIETPHPNTLKLFETLVKKFKNAKLD